MRWSRTNIPLAARRERDGRPRDAPAAISALWDRIADAWPDARADRRDGLRLDWDDRWVHVRASNTEPIVRVIAEAAEPHMARELAAQVGRWVALRHGGAAMSVIRLAHSSSGRRPSRSSTSTARCWPRPPRSCSPGSSIAAAGFAARSFLRGLYHGLQHRFGRLDYGRLIEIGLNYIARIPVVELERIAYENFAEYVRPRLYEGVVDHLTSLRRSGTAIVLVSSSPGLVIQPLAHLSGLHRHADDPRGDRARPAGRHRLGPRLLRRRQAILGRGMGCEPPDRDGGAVAYADNWSDRSLLEQVGRAVVVHPRGRLLRLARAGAGTSFDRAGRPAHG